MKNTFLLSAFCLFLTACSSKNNLNFHADKLGSSGEGNVLHELYEQLKEQRPELGLLEKEIQDIDKAKNESLKDYKEYNARNERGYKIASEHAQLIKDSLLRNSIELLINKSLYAYEQENAAMALADATMENRSTSLHDHQKALQIILTLNLMEKYQKKQIPNSSDYENIINRYNKTIHKVDSLLQAK